VRELQNLVERAAILSHNGVLPNPLSVLVSDRVAANSTVSDPISLRGAPGTFMDSQRAIILQALDGAEWVVGGPQGAAARLGLKRTALIAKMRKLGISRSPRRSETVGLAGG
jgi:formate hydrogenlyase transcriptional activator